MVRIECRVPGCGAAVRGGNVVWWGYSSILSSTRIDLEVTYAFGPAKRPARPGTQAAGQGRGGGGDAAGGRGAHRESGGADGQIRDRPGPAGRVAPGHRPAEQ